MIQIIRPNNRKTYFGYWAAPLFAAIIGAISVISFWLVKPHSYESSLPTFFCFLPMAFFFSAVAQVKSQKQIRSLQRRIEQLEAQSTQPLA